MTYQSVEDSVAYILEAKASGAYILALELTDTSTSLLDFTLPQRFAPEDRQLVLIPGAEASGVAPELLELADAAVHLPMHGQNTSLNVAVALGTAAYLLINQLG